MKKYVLALASIFAALLCLSAGAMAADVTINVAGIANAKGNIRIALYEGAKNFRKPGREVAAIQLRARKGSISVILPGLPKGSYAVAAYHDENADQKLDANMLGMPTEAYGFSRDERGTMGPPDFEQAAFAAAKGPVSTTINLQY